MLDGLDEATLDLLRQTLEREVGFDPGGVEPDEIVERFSDYLDGCEAGGLTEDEKNEQLLELSNGLEQMRIDASGGDREARSRVQGVYDLLEDAVADNKLRPIDLMTIAKVLADAGLTVPESLKGAVADSLNAPSSSGEAMGAVEQDMVSTLLQLAEMVDDNPFDLHDQLEGLLASLPAAAAGEFLAANLVGRSPLVDQAMLGFALHADDEIAKATIRALASRAVREPTPSLQIERLVRMRPWLGPERQSEIDAAVRAMRMNALPPAHTEPAKVAKCLASICDGSGARSLFATSRSGWSHRIATLMIKVDGIAEAIILPEMRKSEMDEFARSLKSSVPTASTDLVGFARLLRLGVADNLESGRAPPFKLVEAAEMLGLGPLTPDPTPPGEIIAALLAESPSHRVDAAAAHRARERVIEVVGDSWFEAGEAVEEALYPVRGRDRRVARLMQDFLPERRAYWTRQCAISALALRGLDAAPQPASTQLAIVGRDLASEAPLADLPLMRHIAETSVTAFESQR
jgi:hypothetical protein